MDRVWPKGHQLGIRLAYDPNSRRLDSQVIGGPRHAQVFEEKLEATIYRLLQRIGPPAGVPNTHEFCDSGPPRRPSHQDLQDLSHALGSLLFGGEVGSAALTALRAARNANTRLNLQLDFSDSHLGHLPWEAATLPDSQHPDSVSLGAHDGLTVVRRLPRNSDRGLAIAGRLRVATIVEDREYTHDIELLREAIQREHADQVFLEEPLIQRGWATASNMLKAGSWHVLIFMGHVAQRNRSTSLRFANDDVDASVFVEGALNSEGLRCVVLLGCSSWHALAESFVRRGVPAVVGTNFNIPCGLPNIGLAPFLSELARTGRIDSAVNALRGAWPPEQKATPVLCVGSNDPHLFTHDPQLLEIGTYIDGLRTRLDRLSVLSDRCDARRDRLYQQRCFDVMSPSDPVPKLPGHRSGSQPQVQSLILHQLTESGAHPWFFVIGDAGVGKTELLADLSWNLARRFLRDPQILPSRIPLKADLSSWKPSRYTSLVEFTSVATSLRQSVVSDLLRNSQAVLLLDGFDEVRPAEKRPELARWLHAELTKEVNRNIGVVISGRPHAFEGLRSHLPSGQYLVLKPFDDDDIESYIRSYFFGDPARASRISGIARSAPRLRTLLQRPLYLMLWCMLMEHGRTSAVSGESHLIEAAVAELLRRRAVNAPITLRRASSLAPELAFHLLGHIAWDLWQGTADRCIEGRRIYNLLVDAIASDSAKHPDFAGLPVAALHDWLTGSTGLLGPAARPGCFRFVEESFLEYVAGRFLADQFSGLTDIFVAHTWDPAWTRVLSFAVERLWSTRRDIAASVVRQLLLEIGAGRDDSWRTLAALVGRFVVGLNTPQDADEQDLLNDAVRAAFAGWRTQVVNRVSSRDRLKAHRRLLDLLTIAENPIRAALVDALNNESTVGPVCELLGLDASKRSLETLFAVFETSSAEGARLAAAEALATSTRQAPLTTIVNLIEDENPDIRRCGAAALGNIGSHQAIELLVSLLRDPNASVRQKAAEILGETDSKLAVPELIKAMGDADENVVSSAVVALGKLKAPEAAAPLLDLLMRLTELYGAGEILQAIYELGGQAAEQALIRALEHPVVGVRTETVSYLVQFPNARVRDVIVRSIRDPNNWFKGKVVNVFGDFWGPSLVPDLVPALLDKEPKVRERAVYLLGFTGSNNAIDPIINTIGDEYPTVSQVAALALTPILGPHEAIRRVVECLDHSSERIRMNVPNALAWLGSRSSSENLQSDYAVPDDVIAEMQQAVGCIGVRALARAIGHSDLEVCRRAVEALGRIATRGAIRTLCEAARHPNLQMRRKLVAALGNAKSPLVVKPLTEIVLDERLDLGVRKSATFSLGKLACPEAVEPLIRLLSVKEVELNWMAAQALGKIGSARAVSALVPLLSHGEGRVRHEVSLALARIASPAGASALVEALDDESADVRIHALDGLGAILAVSAVPRIIGCLKDMSAEVRGHAAATLGKIGALSSVEGLIAATEDNDYLVRLRATEALGMIGSDRASDSLLQVLRAHREDLSEAELENRCQTYPDPVAFESTIDGRKRQLRELAEATGEALGRIGSDRVVDSLIELRKERGGDETGFAALRGLAMIKSPFAIRSLAREAEHGLVWAGQLLDERCGVDGKTVFPDGRLAELSELRLGPFPSNAPPL